MSEDVYERNRREKEEKAAAKARCASYGHADKNIDKLHKKCAACGDVRHI